LIGVPGALLWGVLAGVMRFVPYVGPLVAAVFPLAMAFAVDPGWHMLIWTVVLLLALELIINNLIEPWLYGASTGLAAVAVLVSAAFWTVLWGPVGLLLATPMTVCLVVLGRHLPALRFLDLLLGNDSALLHS
jgi:predicted PurR-regulated permease PerM